MPGSGGGHDGTSGEGAKFYSDLDTFAEFYQANGLQDVVFQLYKHPDGSGKYLLQMILKTSTFTKIINLAEFTV